MNGYSIVTLPGGYWCDGVCYREAELRPVTGDDEAFLLETDESLLPAERTTALLSRCVVRLGSDKVTRETIRSLTVGDREALLLHLRRLSLGEQLQCVLSCVDSDCGKKMDLELKIGDLLLAPYSIIRQRYEVVVTDAQARYCVRVRVPTGADAELAATMAITDPHCAAEGLLRRCIDAVIDDSGQQIDELPRAVLNGVAANLSELDPQAELRLNVACPECGRGFTALFDAGSYFFQEIAAGIKRLYREVHLLAFHYHWSEAEIMEMTQKKRRLYLNLLSEALAPS
jgi:hypothetical protein